VRERALLALAQLQSLLESVHGISAQPVQSYLVGAAMRERLAPSSSPHEALLVSEKGEELHVALFLDDAVLGQLARASSEPWTHARLSGFCAATEGVSHFLYLAHRARQGGQVSQLELEVQGELDKYLAVLLQLWATGRRSASAALRHRLFERSVLRPGLPSGGARSLPAGGRAGGGVRQGAGGALRRRGAARCPPARGAQALPALGWREVLGARPGRRRLGSLTSAGWLLAAGARRGGSGGQLLVIVLSLEGGAHGAVEAHLAGGHFAQREDGRLVLRLDERPRAGHQLPRALGGEEHQREAVVDQREAVLNGDARHLRLLRKGRGS
jgi:hypothetical protein